MPNRTVTLPGVWAQNAIDVPTGTDPTPLTTYRKTGLLESDLLSAWPYTAIVGSAMFNEVMLRLTFLLQELEQNGVLTYSELVNYKVGALVKGTDNIVYECLVVNGPGSAVVDPVGDTTGTWRTALLKKDSIRNISATTSVSIQDTCIIIDASLGDVVLTFLSAANTNAGNIKVQRARTDPGTHTVTLIPQGGQTIGGESTVELLPGEGYEFIPDGSTDFIQF